ncbi:MAG TPA: protein-disulfide reductase DsbD domain-containing protein, partial [Micavibrio sp.]
ALEIALQPDWHIYWRMPGDGGLPPNLLPGDSKNLKNIEIKWPTPHRFEMEGLYGFGYSDQILLPLQLTPEKPSAPLTLALKAEIMVCKDICVPQKLVLSLDIPAGIAKRDSQAPLYEDALKQLPFTENRPDMKIENVVMGPEAIVVRAYLSQGFEGADLFVEGPAFYVMEKPLITPDTKDPRYASLVIKTPPGENIAQAIIGKTLTLTLVNKKGQGLERQFEF